VEKLYNVKPHNLYFSPGIISTITPRRIIWGGHSAHMGEMKHAYILLGKPERTRGNLDVDG
jgi:hypothetical protein